MVSNIMMENNSQINSSNGLVERHARILQELGGKSSSVEEDFKKVLIMGGIPAFLDLMKSQIQYTYAMQVSCRMLLREVLEMYCKGGVSIERNKAEKAKFDSISDGDGLKLFSNILRTHVTKREIVAFVVMTLSLMCRMDSSGEISLQIANNHTIPFIAEAMSCHSHDAMVFTECCSLVIGLCFDDDIKEVLGNAGILEVILEKLDDLIENKVLVQEAMEVIQRLTLLDSIATTLCEHSSFMPLVFRVMREHPLEKEIQLECTTICYNLAALGQTRGYLLHHCVEGDKHALIQSIINHATDLDILHEAFRTIALLVTKRPEATGIEIRDTEEIQQGTSKDSKGQQTEFTQYEQYIVHLDSVGLVDLGRKIQTSFSLSSSISFIKSRAQRNELLAAVKQVLSILTSKEVTGKSGLIEQVLYGKQVQDAKNTKKQVIYCFGHVLVLVVVFIHILISTNEGDGYDITRGTPYSMVESLRNALLKPSFLGDGNSSKSFDNITTLGEIWKFLDGPFRTALTPYNLNVSSAIEERKDTLMKDTAVLMSYQHQVIGTIWLRQMRVNNGTCDVISRMKGPSYFVSLAEGNSTDIPESTSVETSTQSPVPSPTTLPNEMDPFVENDSKAQGVNYCYGEYTMDNEAKKPFSGTKYPGMNFEWTNNSIAGLPPSVGQLSISNYYPGSGYFFALNPPAIDFKELSGKDRKTQLQQESYQKGKSLGSVYKHCLAESLNDAVSPFAHHNLSCTLESLQQDLWIDRSTRVVIVDFIVYNPNVKLYCTGTLMWEIPATGGVIPTAYFRPLSINTNLSSPMNTFLQVLQGILLLGIITDWVMQISAIISSSVFLKALSRTRSNKTNSSQVSTKSVSYFSSYYNWIIIIFLMLATADVALRIYLWTIKLKLVGREVSGTLLSSLNDGTSANGVNTSQVVDGRLPVYMEEIVLEDIQLLGSFRWVADGINAEKLIHAAILMLLYTRVWKYVDWIPPVYSFLVLIKMLIPLASIALAFYFILLCCFAHSGFIAFSPYIEGFRSFPQSIANVIRGSLCSLDFDELEDTDRLFGPFFYMAFKFSVFILVLKFFEIIFLNTYDRSNIQMDNSIRFLGLRTIFNFKTSELREQRIHGIKKKKDPNRKKSLFDSRTNEHQQQQFSIMDMMSDLLERLHFHEIFLTDPSEARRKVERQFEYVDLTQSCFALDVIQEEQDDDEYDGHNYQRTRAAYKVFNEAFLRFAVDDSQRNIESIKMYTAIHAVPKEKKEKEISIMAIHAVEVVMRHMETLGLVFSWEECEVAEILLSAVLDEFPMDSFLSSSAMHDVYQKEILTPIYKYKSLLEEVAIMEKKQSKQIQVLEKRIQTILVEEIRTLQALKDTNGNKSGTQVGDSDDEDLRSS